jgi:ABC-type sugar transport system substrate-binding protein
MLKHGWKPGRRGLRSGIVGLTALVLALSASACGGDSDSTDNAAEGGHTVGYITATGIEYFTCVAKGLKDTVEEAGNTYVQASYDPAKAGSEVAAAEDLLAQDVDAVVLLSTTPRAGLAVVKKVKDAGKKIVVINSDAFLPKDADVDGRWVFDLYELGHSAGELTGKSVDSGSKAAAIEPAPGSGLHDMYQGYKDAVTDAGLTFLGFFPAKSYSPADTQSAAEDLLTSHPDVQVIYTDDSSATAGILAALKSAKSKAVLIPTGGADSDKQKVESGDYLAYSAVAAYPFGVGAGNLTNAIVSGSDPPTDLKPTPIDVTKETIDAAPPFCAPAS